MLWLVFIICLESKLSNLGLASRTFLPTYLRALVATDVDIFRREKVAYFGKHILKELHGLFFSYAKYIIRYAPISPDLIWPSGTSEFRICCQSCQHVSWKVDFRNDGDSLCCSVFYDFANLVLGIPHAFSVWSVVILFAFEDVPDDGLLSDGAHLGQFRIFLDLHSPTLVVGKVPVESVELVYFHDVEVSLDGIHSEEVS